MTDTQTFYRQVIDVNGIETAYLEAGSAHAPPVVLLHDGAFGSDAQSCWSPVIPELSADFRVLVPDLLGYGGTRKLVAFDRDPMTQRLDHVRGFCAALGLDLPFFVGSSFGGGMVLRGAASGALPMKAGITIAGTGGLFMNLEQFSLLQNYEATSEWSRAVCEVMVGDLVTDDMVETRLARSKAPGHYEVLAAPSLVAPVVPASAGDWHPAYQAALSKIDVPILLIEGGDDTLFQTGWAAEMAKFMPTARPVVIAGTRHLPHVQKPHEVAQVIREFLQRG